MKTKLLIAVAMIGLNIAVKGQSQGEESINRNANMKSELPKGLPFKPEDPGVEILNDTWNGNVQTIRYHWQGRNFEEKRVWSPPMPPEPESLQAKRRTVHAALAKSGLDLSDEAVTRILRAFQSANYSGVSDRIRQRPHLVAMLTLRLKRAIAGAAGTSDPAIIEKVLKLDLGIELPPVPDFVVRDNMVEEVYALENPRRAVGGGKN